MTDYQKNDPDAPLSMQTGYLQGRYDFYAFDVRGVAVISTWTVGSAFEMERDVFQTRLNRPGDHIARVEVYRRAGDWQHPDVKAGHWTMYPQAKGNRRE